MRIRALILLVVLAFTALSCGGPDKRLMEMTASPSPPQLVLVERVISGPVLRTSLSKPYGLATDFRDNIIVVDAGNNRLVQFAPDLTPVRDIGGYGQQEGLLNRPTFVSFDNGLNLWVSDEGNRRVSRYNSQLNLVDELSFYDSDDPLKFGYPSGLAFTDYGEIWVADRNNNRIAIFSNVGQFDRFLGDIGYGGGQLKDPEKIVRLRSGDFIVCDAGNRRLVFYDRYGNHTDEIELPDSGYPRAVAESGKFLWVLDSGEGTLVCMNYRGEILYEAGPTITGDQTAVKDPSDLIALPDGRLLISDSGNNRILVCRIIYEEK